jgi:hypothetical protein
MYMHIQHCQHRIRIALNPISFDGRPHGGLAQNQLGEFMQVEQIRIALEKLRKKPFEGLVVDVWVRVEEIKVNIDKTLLSP